MTLDRRGRAAASGLLLVAMGAFAMFSARHLAQTTSGGNMGAGRFPVILSGLLVALGLIVLAQGFVRSARQHEAAVPANPVPWRGVVLLSGAFLVFAITVRPLGLGLAMTAAVVLSCLASPSWRPLPTLYLTLGMVSCGWLLFVRLLGLPIPLFGTWFH